ncbi:MAG: methyltransferase domain-containing protein [Planctomycetota bacterium]
MEHLSFISAAMRDKNVGALVPTTFASVRHICRKIDCDRPVVVVEYGPGTGAFTRHLLKRLHPGSTIIAIELNFKFARQLRRFAQRRKQRTPKLIVSNNDARNVLKILQKQGLDHADYVLSGIPFSFLPEPLKRDIIRCTHEALRPGGTFLVYQYSFHVRRFVGEVFEDMKVSRTFFNLPPLCVMAANKQAGAVVSVSRPEFGGEGLQAPVLVDARQS